MMNLCRFFSIFFLIFLAFTSQFSIAKSREISKIARKRLNSGKLESDIPELSESSSQNLFSGSVIAWDLHEVLFFGKPSLFSTFWHYPHKRKLFPKGKTKKIIWKEIKRLIFGGNTARLNSSELIDLAQTHGDYDIVAFIMQHETSCVPDPNMVALIKELHDQGYRQYICSNISEQGLSVLQAQYPEVFQYFDGTYTTRKNNSRKPNDRFFRLFLEEYHIQPEEVLFIDDKRENCASARRLGMSAIRFSKHTRKRSQSIMKIKKVTTQNVSHKRITAG